MISFLLIIFLIFSLTQQAKAWTSYQFEIIENQVRLTWPVKEIFDEINAQPSIIPSPSLIPSPVKTERFLLFNLTSAELNWNENENIDLPMLVLQLANQAIFYFTSQDLHKLSSEEFLDLNELSETDKNAQAIISSHSLVFNPVLQFKTWQWRSRIDLKLNQDQLSDLALIKEENELTSILFTLLQSERQAVKIFLACMAENGEILHSQQLVQEDNFLFPELRFSNFFPNQRNQLIFQLALPACQSQTWSVYSQNQTGMPSALSPSMQEITIEDLQNAV